MKIEFLAHASFMLTRDNGTQILLDPYESGSFSGRIGYAPIEETPDVIVITHDHKDHSHTETIDGQFRIIRHQDQFDGLNVYSVPVFHDQEQGTKFGGVIDMKILEFDGWRICHCGDIGETLDDPNKVKALQGLDILIIPVGGFYTVDATLAHLVTHKIKPRLVIPCHYKTLSCGFDIADRTPFVQLFEHISECESWQTTLDLETVRNQPDVIQCMTMEMKYDRAIEQVVGYYRPKSHV